MKRLLHTQLWQTWTGVVVLACTLAGLVAIFVLALHTQRGFHSLSEYLYDRCLAYERLNTAASTARRAQVVYFDEVIREETTNRFVNSSLRAKRVRNAETVRDALVKAIEAQPVSGTCVRYKL